MFELPINQSSAKGVGAAASLVCEAFYREREMYKCHSNCVCRTDDGKARFGMPDIHSDRKVVEKHPITKEVLDAALKEIKEKGWHVYKRVWYVQSGLNWSYVMCDSIPMRVHENNSFTILF